MKISTFGAIVAGGGATCPRAFSTEATMSSVDGSGGNPDRMSSVRPYEAPDKLVVVSGAAVGRRLMTNVGASRLAFSRSMPEPPARVVAAAAGTAFWIGGGGGGGGGVRASARIRSASTPSCAPYSSSLRGFSSNTFSGRTDAPARGPRRWDTAFVMIRTAATLMRSQTSKREGSSPLVLGRSSMTGTSEVAMVQFPAPSLRATFRRSAPSASSIGPTTLGMM